MSVCFSTQMGTTPSVGAPGADASSMRPPGISVAAKWTLPPGTWSQGESICRRAVSALREFIFGESGHFWTTKEVTIWATVGSGFDVDVGVGVTASGGFVRAHEAVKANPRKPQIERPALTFTPPNGIRILEEIP